MKVPSSAAPETDLQLSLLSPASLLAPAIPCTYWHGAQSHQVFQGADWLPSFLPAFQPAVRTPAAFSLLVE